MIQDLLKAFIPSWRFFIEPEPKIYLLAREGPSKENLGPWKTLNPALSRDATKIFFNPHGNLLHAYNNAIRRFVDVSNDAGNSEPEYFVKTQEYKILHNIVLHHTRGSKFYQFALTLSPAMSNENSEDVALLSEVCERGK